MLARITKVRAAWQFLRRNQQYRHEYGAYRDLASHLETVYGPAQLWTERALREEPRAWHYWPPRKPAENEKAWRVRVVCEGHEPRKGLLHTAYARKWGLAELVDPSQESSDNVRFLLERSPPIWYRAEDIEGEPLGEADDIPSTFYVRLDASKSVTRQLTAVRKALVGQQRRLKKYGLKWRTTLHAGKWALYLRVFDAYAAGASAKDIAEVEFPHLADEFPDYAGQARVRATYEQAVALVKGGYRLIVQAED